MPLHADATVDQIAVLAGWLAPSLRPASADEYEVGAWLDDPRSVGAREADFSGYTPATVTPADWEISELEVVTSALVDLGTPAGAASAALRFWSLRNTTTGLVAYSGPLSTPITVAAGPNPVQIRPRIRNAI